MKTKLTLNDAFKVLTYDQDKTIPPAETIARFKKRLQKINLDILQRTVRIDNGRLGIPVFFSVCGDDARSIIGTKKQMGKGATPEQAEASAVMELAERFSFFSFCKDRKRFTTDTAANLKENALSFEFIARSVHDDSEELPLARRIFETLPLKWTPAFDFTRDRTILVPFDWFFMINEFNGPSAGNCIEEALSQGICEIVERHVSSIISRKRQRVPAIRADSVTDPAARELIRKYQRAGIRLYLSDFSLDMGIPTVAAMAFDPATFPATSEIVWTAGTTPDPQKALCRALTEVAQLGGDFNTGANYVASGLPKLNSFADADFVINPGCDIPISQLPDLSSHNIKDEIIGCISALSKQALDVFVIDTTHPGLDIPALYTIIPGAHFRERAVGTSVGMFCAKLIAENRPPLDAIAELHAAEKILSDRYYLKFYLGSCYLALLDPEQALPFFRQALALDPTGEDLPSIYSYTGVCLKEMGKYREALSVLRQGLAMDHERTDIHNLMGFCHFKLKEYEKAIVCFKRLLEIDPSSAIDYANIGSNYRDLGRPEKAIEYYTTALMMDPTIEFARKSLARLKNQ